MTDDGCDDDDDDDDNDHDDDCHMSCMGYMLEVADTTNINRCFKFNFV